MSELYQLPDGWEWKKLDKVTDVISGFAFKSSDFSSSNEIRSIKITNVGVNEFIPDEDNRLPISLTDKLSKYMVSTGDIVIALTRPYISNGLKVCFVPDSYNCAFINQRVAAIKSKNEVTLNKYIYYYLCTYDVLDSVIELSKTLNQPNLSIKDLEEFAVPLPPIPEQKRIVQKLDALFERIDKAIALLQKNIDAADNFMNSVLNDVFSDLEQRNGLVQINDIVVKTKNKNPMDGNNQLFTYIDISSIDNNLFKIVEPKTLQTCEAPSRARKEIRLGDIVYSTTRPNLKNIAIVDKVYDNPIASTGFCVLRVNQKANNRFLFYYLITSHLFTQIEPKIRGAQYPAISDSDLKDCFISNALLSVQQKVVAYLDNVLVKIEQVKSAQQQKMQNLLDLKLSILDQAFHGKL